MGASPQGWRRSTGECPYPGLRATITCWWQSGVVRHRLPGGVRLA